MTKNILFIAFLILNILVSLEADARGVTLSKNPFVKPNSVSSFKNEFQTTNNMGEVLTDRNLRATLSSTDRSIANIDGIMVFVGEKIKGYTLLSVGEGSATFEKNEKIITLNVSELHKKLK